MDHSVPARASLVVEDELFIRMVAVDVLSEHGLPMYEAGCAAEALLMIAEHPDIALMFTDIQMPGAMDGMALAADVFATQPHIALIVTSGGQRLSDDDIPDHGVFLATPYRPSDLMELAERQLAL